MTEAQYMPTLVRQWLTVLHGRSTGWVHIASASPLADGGTKWAGGKAFPASPEGLDLAALYVDSLERLGRSGIYTRVTSTREAPAPDVDGVIRKRGSSAESSTLPGLWADVDIAGPGHAHDPARHGGLILPEDVDTARMIVAVAGLPEPTLWQHSGGGLYPWWLLDEPLALDDANRDQVADVSTRLGRILADAAQTIGYHYGAGVHDLARVLRLPGTINRKDGLARQSSIIASSGKKYSMHELADAIQAYKLAEPVVAVVEPATRRTPVARPGMTPLDAFEEATDIADVLQPWGWTLTRRLLDGEEHWRRPGGTSDMSAKWNLNGVPVLVVHSSSAGLPDGPGRRLTIARTYAHLNYAGDVRALSSALLAYAGGNPAATLPMLDNAPAIAGFVRDACHVKGYSPGAGHTDREAFDALVGSDPAPLTLKSQDPEQVPAGTSVPVAPVAKGTGDTDQPDSRLIAEFSDAQLAETIAARVFADRYVWTAGGGWFRYTGQVWEECDVVQAVEAVRVFFKGWAVREIRQGGTDTQRVKQLLGLLSGGRINGVTALARGLIVRQLAEFDADPDIFNTPSGVVDFRTGNKLPHDPAYLCTRIAGVGYTEGATSELWEKALQALPADARDWLQIRIGQALTGYMTPDDLLIVSQGGGQNAKSTIYSALNSVIGTYGRMISDRVLLANTDAHPTEMMDLRGLRYAFIDETPEARKLDVTRLKKSIGTPEITARHIRKDSVTFKATHSLFVNSNYRPIVTETDHGTWRRLALLVFPYRYVNSEAEIIGPNDRLGDPRLRQQLVEAPEPAAQAAVLAWAVEGAIRWYKAGRIMPPLPESVIAATRQWREESDQVLAYVGERLIFDRDAHIMSTELLADFSQWLEGQGGRAWSDRMLTSRLGDHDEVTAHSVTKKRLRHRDGLSRSSHVKAGWVSADALSGLTAEVPSQYMAWIGVRFRSDDEQASEQAI